MFSKAICFETDYWILWIDMKVSISLKDSQSIFSSTQLLQHMCLKSRSCGVKDRACTNFGDVCENRIVNFQQLQELPVAILLTLW